MRLRTSPGRRRKGEVSWFNSVMASSSALVFGGGVGLLEAIRSWVGLAADCGGFPGMDVLVCCCEIDWPLSSLMLFDIVNLDLMRWPIDAILLNSASVQ